MSLPCSPSQGGDSYIQVINFFASHSLIFVVGVVYFGTDIRCKLDIDGDGYITIS